MFERTWPETRLGEAGRGFVQRLLNVHCIAFCFNGAEQMMKRNI